MIVKNRNLRAVREQLASADLPENLKQFLQCYICKHNPLHCGHLRDKPDEDGLCRRLRIQSKSLLTSDNGIGL